MERHHVLNLSVKFAGLTILLIVLTVGGVALVVYFSIRSQLIEEERMRVDRVFSFSETQLNIKLDHFRDDLIFLSHAPAVLALMRAELNGGEDPVIGATVEEWKTQTAALFRNMLKVKTQYHQIRLIRKDRGGYELIRVDRRGDHVERRAEADLQNKGHRDYFQETILLNPDQVYISPVNLNREHGEVSQPPTPTLRAATPVYDPQGRMYGILVINISARFLSQITTLNSYANWVTNETGDFLVHPDPSRTFGFEYNKPYRFQDQFPQATGYFSEGRTRINTLFLEEPDDQFAFVMIERVSIAAGKAPRVLYFGLGVTKDKVLAAFSQTLNPLISFSLLMMLLGILLALIFARHLTGPLKIMRDKLQEYRKTGVWTPVILQRRDEMRELAQAFTDFIAEISRKTAALNESNERLTQETRQREKMNQMLQHLNQKLIQKNAELDKFAYITSHDLKAPLRGLSSLAEWIEQDLGADLPEEVQEHLTLMKSRVVRLQALIDGILVYSRAGRANGGGELVDLNAVLSDILDMISKQEGFEIEVQQPLPQVFGERVKLQQVFSNLIQNALNHHDGKQGRIQIAFEETGAFYEFKVADDGPGIPPEFHARVFEMFQRLETRDKKEGTGVGLALVKKIIEDQGGQIWIEQGSPRGAVFRFTLPRVQNQTVTQLQEDPS